MQSGGSITMTDAERRDLGSARMFDGLVVFCTDTDKTWMLDKARWTDITPPKKIAAVTGNNSGQVVTIYQLIMILEALGLLGASSKKDH